MLQKIYVIWYSFFILGTSLFLLDLLKLSNFLSLDPVFPKTKIIYFWLQTMKNYSVWRKVFERYIFILSVLADIVGVLFFRLQWWKEYLRISLRFKKFQKCPLPLTQCWDRHAFLPQLPTSTTFPTLKVGGGGFFSKYFFQGCLKTFLHSNNLCMYFGGKKLP